METKSLLIGITSFIAGGLLVSIAATTFDKSSSPEKDSMSSMTESLRDKTGGEYDKEFIAQMIVHHEGAVEMARLSRDRANHEEIKKLSDTIIAAQESEISMMKQWQAQWGYDTPSHDSHMSH